MKTWTNPTLDRTGWPAGPWDAEPDKMSWTDDTTGLPCLIVRNRGGALCGYVGVEPGHPWHGKGYSECTAAEPCDDSWCQHSPLMLTEGGHGELTYADGCQHGDDEATGICHVPDPGRSDDVWWFGFDCAHAFDRTPGLSRFGFLTDEIYRDVVYVQGCVTDLAAELAAVVAVAEGGGQ